MRSFANGFAPRPVDPVGARQPMEPGSGGAVIYRVCSLARLEDELGASVVGMWNGAASELDGAVLTSDD